MHETDSRQLGQIADVQSLALPVVETDIRMAELMATVSLATDLANSFPSETALRVYLLATTLGLEAGLHSEELSDVYYVALLRYLGLHVVRPRGGRRGGRRRGSAVGDGRRRIRAS